MLDEDNIRDLNNRIQSLEHVAKQSEAMFQSLCFIDYELMFLRSVTYPLVYLVLF